MDEGDFKECIIRLMQHPIANTPASELNTRIAEAYDLVSAVDDLSTLEGYTLEDNIQKARLKFCLAELADKEELNCEIPLKYYREAFSLLQKGGLDLGFKKWLELVSIRTHIEDF